MKITKYKKFFFSIIMLLLPLVGFVFFELILILFNYGGNLDIFILQDNQGKKEFVLNKNFTRRYFFKEGIEPPNPRTQTFSVEKGKDSYRIFCLGASTTQGVPYPPNAAFPAMLKNILSTLHPGKNFEVINCGVTAITSHSVLDMAEEILRKYEPDLLIVYTGHNEFYGVFGQASRLSLFQSQFLVQLFLKLQRLRTFLLARDISVKFIGEKVTRESVVDPATLMGTLATEAGIPFGSPVFKRAQEHFQKNIESLIKSTKKKQKNILVCTLVSNIKDLKPFESLHLPSFSAEANNQYDDILGKAEEYLKNNLAQEAMQILDEALELDSTYAYTHYILGECYYAMNDFNRAKTHFSIARDLDAIRFRAPTSFNDIIIQLCRSYPNVLVDIESAFSQASPHGIIGDNLILEHIHPGNVGYYLMARTIAKRMSDYGMITTPWDWTRDFPDSVYLAMSHLSLLSHEIVHAAVYKLKTHWPFSQSEVRPAYQRIGTARTEELALAYVFRRQGSLVQLHLELGYEYFMHQQLISALQEYEAALAIEPSCDAFNLIALCYSSQVEHDRGNPAKVRLSLENFNKALNYFDKGLSICPDNLELIYNRGVLYSMLIRGVEEAERSFRKVLSINPVHKNARISLSKLYLHNNRIEDAEKILINGIEKQPGEIDYYKELGKLYITLKQYHQAKSWFLKGLSLESNNSELMDFLEKIELLE